MLAGAWYNEIDSYAAEWLGNLVAAGHLPAGAVDRRDIRDVHAADLSPYRECHFFAGIGGWPYALRLAGWPEDREVWTGSCPCQPLSSAGQRKGHADERHLWPAFYRLIAERRPPTVFGEQVASKDGREWLAGIRADLEGLGYAVGAADLCAAGVGAPHIRQRLFWVAHATGARCDGQIGDTEGNSRDEARLLVSGEYSAIERVAFAECIRRPRDERRQGSRDKPEPTRGRRLGVTPGIARSISGQGRQDVPEIGRSGAAGGVDDAECNGRRAQRDHYRSDERDEPASAWSDSRWLPCLDGKARRVEPGIFPLAYGVPSRVGKLRAAGNAIVPQVAAEFVRAFMDIAFREGV